MTPPEKSQEVRDIGAQLEAIKSELECVMAADPYAPHQAICDLYAAFLNTILHPWKARVDQPDKALRGCVARIDTNRMEVKVYWDHVVFGRGATHVVWNAFIQLGRSVFEAVGHTEAVGYTKAQWERLVADHDCLRLPPVI